MRKAALNDDAGISGTAPWRRAEGVVTDGSRESVEGGAVPLDISGSPDRFGSVPGRTGPLRNVTADAQPCSRHRSAALPERR
ncbi:hypothetical protein ACFPYM_18035, partial [Methylobacterium hispanicum]